MKVVKILFLLLTFLLPLSLLGYDHWQHGISFDYYYADVSSQSFFKNWELRNPGHGVGGGYQANYKAHKNFSFSSGIKYRYQSFSFGLSDPPPSTGMFTYGNDLQLHVAEIPFRLKIKNTMRESFFPFLLLEGGFNSPIHAYREVSKQYIGGGKGEPLIKGLN